MMDEAALSNVLAWSTQVAVLTIVAAILPLLLRVDAPAIRHAWWRVMLLVCLVLPLVQPWHVVPAASIEMPELDMTPALTGSRSARTGASSAFLLPGMQTSPWPAALGVVILIGAVARFGWLLLGLVRLRRLRAAGRPAEITDGHRELAALTEAGAEIRFVPVIGQPVTFGIRHPVVLLPESLRSLPDPIQRAVLAHELWHVRRHDWLWILAEETVRAVLWFHPAIWYLVSRVQSSREEVVDELTVMLTNARRTYVEALLAFADEPPLFAAAPFARRRHLFQRMLLISREAVMSSRRIVASSAAMAAVVLIAGSYGVAAFPLTTAAHAEPAAVAIPPEQSGAAGARQMPPRDLRPGQPAPASNREIELQKAIAGGPGATAAVFLELAKLQEQRGAVAEAESTLLAARSALANPSSVMPELMRFYLRTNQFDKAVAVVEEFAAADPSNPKSHQVVATFYWEKAFKDQTLTPAQKATYIQAGIAATDRALTYDPDYVEALTYKNILLRMQANTETDRTRQTQLLAEADALRNRAMELNKARGTSGQGGAAAPGMPPPPPPPPPPGQGPVELVDGQAPIRVGGNIAPPRKLTDVRPVYPDDAKGESIQGVVIIEAVIDAAGDVRSAKVLRSIPKLDQAALEAVQQWKFQPTLLNGAPVPVIMTVTVNFSLQ